MKILFYFQINPSHARQAWERVKHLEKWQHSRADAVALAKRAAKLYCAEVRLTTGPATSGSYFRGY